VADDEGVDDVSYRNLPCVIFPHPRGRSALTDGCSLGVLAPDGLPAKGSEYFTHNVEVSCAFQDLLIRDG
jgi:hypothetical protein